MCSILRRSGFFRWLSCRSRWVEEERYPWIFKVKVSAGFLQGYLALAILKVFNFLPKVWIFQGLLNLSSDIVPLLKIFWSLFREKIITSRQTVSLTACRTYALHPFGSMATSGVIPFTLTSLALPLITTGLLDIVIKSVLLICGFSIGVGGVFYTVIGGNRAVGKLIVASLSVV